MKILALDIGDAWTGSALSDLSGMFARPYRTVPSDQLKTFLTEIFSAESISKIVVGYPRTMRGTASEQTKKIESIKQELEKEYSDKQWILWDERLSSKRAAQQSKKMLSKEEKIKSHSIAAAFILESYLTFVHQFATPEDEQ
ncbi:MAG: Holliday junction resolvase RuvX [Candidatus Dependentiae bacterium]